MVSLISIIKFIACSAFLIIFLWFIYVDNICLGLAFIIIGVIGTFLGTKHLEAEFSPERP